MWSNVIADCRCRYDSALKAQAAKRLNPELMLCAIAPTLLLVPIATSTIMVFFELWHRGAAIHYTDSSRTSREVREVQLTVIAAIRLTGGLEYRSGRITLP
jgi:predicted deacylase